MRAEIVTICDEQFAPMLRVALSSLHLFGGAGDAKMVVYDFGLSDNARQWCESKEIEVRSVDGAPRALLPVGLSGRQRTFDLWLCKTFAIWDAAMQLNEGDVVVFVDSDMAFLEPVVPPILERVAEAGPHWVACVDAMDCPTTVRSFTGNRDADAPEWWDAHFGMDLSRMATWNIGLLAARSEIIAGSYMNWQALNAKWPSEYAGAVPIPCFDQLTFAVANHDIVTELAAEFNVTRPLWNIRKLAAIARSIHLTGPIKPWQPGGQLHPMTFVWRQVETACRKAGYFD